MFVHARNATVKTATSLRDQAAAFGDLPLFAPEQGSKLGHAEKQVCNLCLCALICNDKLLLSILEYSQTLFSHFRLIILGTSSFVISSMMGSVSTMLVCCVKTGLSWNACSLKV